MSDGIRVKRMCVCVGERQRGREEEKKKEKKNGCLKENRYRRERRGEMSVCVHS